MKINYQKFWLILYCWTTQVPVKQTARLAGISRKGVYAWNDLFRAHLPHQSLMLSKIIQLDEAYFKGWSLVMGKQPGTRRLAFELISGNSVQRHHAKFFCEQYVDPGSNLHTDGAAIYRTIEKWWPVIHKVDIHKKFEFGLTSEIEGVFGNLRTFIRRMYHHATPEKLPEIVREFSVRFSSPEMFENPRFYLEKSLTLVP